MFAKTSRLILRALSERWGSSGQAGVQGALPPVAFAGTPLVAVGEKFLSFSCREEC